MAFYASRKDKQNHLISEIHSRYYYFGEWSFLERNHHQVSKYWRSRIVWYAVHSFFSYQEILLVSSVSTPGRPTFRLRAGPTRKPRTGNREDRCRGWRIGGLYRTEKELHAKDRDVLTSNAEASILATQHSAIPGYCKKSFAGANKPRERSPCSATTYRKGSLSTTSY